MPPVLTSVMKLQPKNYHFTGKRNCIKRSRNAGAGNILSLSGRGTINATTRAGEIAFVESSIK